MKTASLKTSSRRRARHTRARHLLFEGLEDRRLLTGVELISAAHPDVLSATASGESSLLRGSMSADGRYVAFVSNAPDLVPGLYIAPGVQNVYRYDHHTGEVVLVSMNADGTGSGNAESGIPAISADGSVVAFQSPANNLHPLDTDGLDDIFARNLTTGTTHLVSVNTDGTSSGNFASRYPVISADGSVVAFQSQADNLHSLDTDTTTDIFARNLTTGTTHLVSMNADGTGSGNAHSHDPVISADGSVIAFKSFATNLHPLNTVAGFDIFARNLTTGTTHLVSMNADGTGGSNGESYNPAISADGSVIAFESGASNLHSLDTNTTSDVFARDLPNGTTHLVSVNVDGTGGGNSGSYNPAISADGSVIAFDSRASNLHPLDTISYGGGLSYADVFVRNLTNGTTTLVSINAAGTSGGNSSSYVPAISADGSVVVFLSQADTLHSLGTNRQIDVYARNLTNSTTQLVSVNAASTGSGNNNSTTSAISADGSVIAFASYASNLVERDLNGSVDVFRFSLGTTEVSLVGDDVVITDTDGGNTNDTIAVSSDGTSLVLHDPNNRLATSIPGATGDGSHSITIPLTTFSGAIMINSLGGDDTVTIDFSSGNPLQAGGLTFDGGDGDGRLLIVGYSLIDADGTADLVVTNTSFDSGSVELAGLGTVNFDKIAGLTLGGTAADVAISLPQGADSVTLGDDGGTQDGNGNTANTSALYDSTGPAQSVTFVEFSNPTNSLWLRRGDATVDLNVLDLAVSDMTASLAVGEVSGEFDQVTFSGRLVLAEHKSLAVNATGTISLATAAADLATSGSGAIELTTARNITLASGSSVTTVDGSIAVEANQQSVASGGSFVGVAVNGGTIQSLGLGSITVKGRGGNTGASQDGVYIGGEGKIIGGGSGQVLVEGVGGATAGGGTRGVFLIDVNSRITSTGGSVLVTGQAAANNSSSSHGVVVVGGGEISAGGDGAVTVVGHGGGTTIGGHNNAGVFIGFSNARITSSGGNVAVSGIGGGRTTSNDNDGVRVTSSGIITAGGSGSVTVTGHGGNASGTGNFNYGVQITAMNSQVTSSGGDITITGTSGAGASSEAIKVSETGEIVSSTGTAVVTLIGDSLNLESSVSVDAGSNSVIVHPRTIGTSINLGGADVLSGSPLSLGLADGELDGITAGTLQIGSNTSGVISITSNISPAGTNTLHLTSGEQITQSGAGGLQVANLAAEAGSGIEFGFASNNVDTVALATAAGGASFVDIDGFTLGVVDGVQGATAALNVQMGVTGVGDVTVSHDIQAGTLVLINLQTPEGLLTVDAGVQINAPTGLHEYYADRMQLDGTIVGNSVRLAQNQYGSSAGRLIDLGSATDVASNTLELSDAELDGITADILRIGSNSTGAITISQSLSRAVGSALVLTTGSTVSQSAEIVSVSDLAITAGGSVTLNNSNNDVATIAVKTTTANITFVDENDLVVGAVYNVQGIDTDNGSVWLTATTGNFTVANTSAANDIEATGLIDIRLYGAEGTLNLLASANVAASANGVIMQANEMVLDGTIAALGGTVSLRTAGSNTSLNAGTATGLANTVELSDAELDRITANWLELASGNGLTSIEISGPISPANAGTLILTSNDDVRQVGTGSLTVSNLSVRVAYGEIALGLNANEVDNVSLYKSFSGYSGDVDYRDATGFQVTQVANWPGLYFPNGNLTLTAESGDITIANTGLASDIEVSGTISIDVLGDDASLTIANGANVKSTGGAHRYTADKMILDGTITATGQMVTLRPNEFGEAILVGSTTDAAIDNLELSDSELDRVTAETLVIGRNDIATGTVTVSNAIAPANANALSVVTARDIVVTANLTGGSGGLTLSANQQATPVAEDFVGVKIEGAAIVTATEAGHVQVLGTGGAGSGAFNIGVNLTNSGQINSGGAGAVTVMGIGGAGSGGGNRGVQVSDSDSAITSGGGNVIVTGQGGGAAGSGNGNFGVFNSGQITSSGSGTVTVLGIGGTGSGQGNVGVYVMDPGAAITSGGGAGSVSGQGGGGAGSGGTNVGVYVVNSGQVTSGGAGTVTVLGTGGAGPGSYNVGVYVINSGSAITSGGGDVSVTGIGTSNSEAVRLESLGAIASGSDAPITITADSLSFTGTSLGVISSGAGTTAIRTRTPGTLVSLGGADVLNGSPLTLGLADAELDRITAGTLRIGNSISGAMSITSHISPAGTDTLHLISGGTISQSNGVVITEDKLAIEAGGPVSLADYYHQVNTLAITSTLGTVEFRDLDSFAVGVVDGIRGVRTTDGNVVLVSAAGNLTIEDASVENEIEGRFVSLMLPGNDAQLTVAAGAQVRTHVTGVNLWADKIDLQGSVLATGQQVTLRPHQAGKAIDLGSDVDATPNMLELSDAELDRVNAGTLNIGNTDSGSITVSAALTHGNRLNLTTGNGVTFDQSVTMAADKDLVVTALGAGTGTISLATADADLAASGTGLISLTTARNIVLSNGSSVTTVDGALSLQANQQTTLTGGNFIGVDVFGGTIEVLGSGTAVVRGRGGDSEFGDQHGVRVTGGGRIVGGTNALLAVEGMGGLATGNGNNGVILDGMNATLTSHGGSVAVAGTGGGVDSTTYNQGVRVLTGEITAGGNGTVTVVGHGGNDSGTGGSNFGVSVEGFITSGSGDVSVTGYGGNTAGTGNDNFGVMVAGENVRITSGGGHVVVTGTGGGGGGSVFNLGVLVENAGEISAGGSGTVTVVGNGRSTAGSGGWDYGVLLAGADARITSGGGDIGVTGTPGDGPSSFGIATESGGQIVATTGAPTVTLRADSLDLTSDASVYAGDNAVVLEPKTVGTLIDLGGADELTGGPQTLGLSAVELDRITAGVVRIGTLTSGPLTISSLVQPTGIDTLHLFSGGTIDDGEQGQLIVSQLAVQSQGSITLDGYLDNGTPIYHQVGVLAGQALAPGSSLTFISQGGTVIGTVDGMTGASANGGGVTVVTHSPLTVNAPVIEQGGGPIRLVASTEDGVNDDLTINSPVQVLGGSGGIELFAGSDVRITSNATSSGSILTQGGGPISIAAEQSIAIDGASILAQQGGSVGLTAGTDLVIQAGIDGASITAEGGGSVDLSAGTDLVIQASDDVEVMIAADGQGTLAVTAGGYVEVDGTVQLVTDSAPPTLSGTARLTVAVDPASRLYGQADPQFTVSFDGFAPGHDPSLLGGELVFATNATTDSGAGSYTITASGLTAPTSGLVYQIEYVAGLFTVIPAPLTITVNDATKIEGDANPVFTVRYDGFVLNQDASVLGGVVAYDTDADESSPAGTYQVLAAGLSSSDYAITFVPGTLRVYPAFKPYSISGLVFVDFNSDSEVNFGESGIAVAAVTLTGTNDLGHSVEETVWTDEDGFYKFSELRPGAYYVTESQPTNYPQGNNSVGTLGGVLSAVDQFFLQLGAEAVHSSVNTDGLNYNFGEWPPVDGTIVPGQTAGIGFWQNKNGQALIQSLNGGAQATQLGDWLAITLPNMFGQLTGQSNADVGSYFRTLFAVRGQKLEAQVMATALAVYITNQTLAGNAGGAYGFVVTQYGVGSRKYNVGTNGAAFGVQDHSDVSVLDLLLATDEMAVGGVLYYSNNSILMKALRNMANEVFSDING